MNTVTFSMYSSQLNRTKKLKQKPLTPTEAQTNFADTLKDAIENVNETQD